MIFYCFSKSQKDTLENTDKSWAIAEFYENVTDEVKEDLKLLSLILIVLLILMSLLHFLQNRFLFR